VVIREIGNIQQPLRLRSDSTPGPLSDRSSSNSRATTTGAVIRGSNPYWGSHDSASNSSGTFVVRISAPLA
jgi:hypothetical protein